MAELDGPHMSGCPLLPNAIYPQSMIGSSKPKVQASLVMVQDRLDITEYEDEKQVSICHRGDVHAGKCPSILLTQLPSREKLRWIPKAAAFPSGNVSLAKGRRRRLSKEVAAGAQMGTSNLVPSSWIQCCVFCIKCLLPTEALEKGDPSVDYNNGEDKYSFAKQVEVVKSSKGGCGQGLESFPKGLNL